MKQHDVIWQYSDQAHCHICGKTWDMNDQNQPDCGDEPKTLWTRFKEWLKS